MISIYRDWKCPKVKEITCRKVYKSKDTGDKLTTYSNSLVTWLISKSITIMYSLTININELIITRPKSAINVNVN